MTNWKENYTRAFKSFKKMKEDLKEGEAEFSYFISTYKDAIFYFFRGKGYKEWYMNKKDRKLKEKAIEDFKRAYQYFPMKEWKKKAEREMKELGEVSVDTKIEEIIQAVKKERERVEDVKNRQPYFIFNLSEIFEEENIKYGKRVCLIFENYHERIEIDMAHKGHGKKLSYFKFGDEFFKGYAEIEEEKLKVFIPLEINSLDDSQIEKLREIAENEGIYYISDFRRNVDQLEKFLLSQKYQKNKYLDYFFNEIKEPAQITQPIKLEEEMLQNRFTSSHLEAIKKSLSQEVLFIWGPPGTGKTEVLCNIAKILFSSGYKILLISLSNNTVDHLLRKFIKVCKIDEGTEEVMRLGDIRPTTSYDLLPFFSSKISPQTKLVACNFNNIIFRKSFPVFDFVLIDEVSMTPIPLIVAASYLAKRGLILAGDPFQLPPPYPKEMEIPNEWYSKNIFEKIGVSFENFERILEDKRCVFLNTQFRMEEEISNLVSELFYKGKLRCGKRDSILNINKRVFFLNSQGKIEVGKELLHRRNETHAKAIVNYIEKKLSDILNQYLLTIGIITPYNSQVCTIYKYLKEKDLLSHPSLKIGTVHSFQGQEADIIFFDITDVNNVEPSPLILDKKLLNVALSRAREGIIIIGDKDYLLNSGFFKEDIREIYKKIIEIGEIKNGDEEWKRLMLP